MTRASWLIPATLMSTQFAHAGTVQLLPSRLEMPDRIGPLVYGGAPSSWEDPRLGKAYEYSAAGVRLDVYVYDAGIQGIPEGAVSRPVCEQFEQAKVEVMRAGYKDVVVKGEQLARMGNTQDPPLAREVVFDAVMNDAPRVSYLWMTAVGGNFMKLRFTINGKLSYEIEDARRAVLNAVGDAIRPHLAPPAPAQDEKPKSMTLVLNPRATADEMGFGLLYLTAISLQASRQPEALPPCGGPLRPGYGGELAAWQIALSLPVGKPEASEFSRKIAEVQEAGFLEEFVWIYCHQQFWGTSEPAGLDLPAFTAWSRKHLEGLNVPQFGYVMLNETRKLPIEPLP